HLQPLVSVPGNIDPIPLIDDPDVLTRIAELSRKMGIAVPKARLHHSLNPTLDQQGWAIGFAAPSIVITDGILLRLSPQECDSTIAHELAHIANGSLWILMLITPITGVFAIIISIFVPPEIALTS